MKKLFFCILFLIIVTFSVNFVTAQNTPDFFELRIADFMPLRNTFPNMDDYAYVQRFEAALTDLENASQGGEISHVQLRLYWYVDANDSSTWNYPILGSNDTSQQELMNNWRKWYFGEGVPSSYQTAIERIKAHGFKVEI